MAKIIEYNKETKVFSVTERCVSFSNFLKEDLEDFHELKKDLSDTNPEEYVGKYSRLIFRNQPKTYFIFYPPKSGNGSPHIELSVHPDSTFDFSESFDPTKYLSGLLRVQLLDKRRFKSLSISHRDYDLLATFFNMEFSKKLALKLGDVEVLLEDKKITFDKIFDILNNFSDGFYLNDLKRIFPFSDLSTYYISKVHKDVVFTAKFLKTCIRLSMIVDKKPVIVMELNTNGLITILLDEEDLLNVMSEKDYIELFSKVFSSGRSGFNKLDIEFISGNMKKSPLKDAYKNYNISGESVNLFNIK